MTKVCSKCFSEKDVSCFVRGVCKACKSKYLKRYKELNIDKLKALNKKYNKANKNKLKKYCNENKPKIREAERKYYKKRIVEDNLFKLRKRTRSLIIKSIKNKKFKKENSTEVMLGCSFDEFKLYLESKFESWMDWDNHGKYNGQANFGWDIDHIIPLILAETEEEIIKLNHYTNLQPLCSYVNRYIKKDIIPCLA